MATAVVSNRVHLSLRMPLRVQYSGQHLRMQEAVHGTSGAAAAAAARVTLVAVRLTLPAAVLETWAAVHDNGLPGSAFSFFFRLLRRCLPSLGLFLRAS